MTLPLAMVLALLAVAIVLFAIGRPRMDVVALVMMVALPLTGVITVPEALAGFADPNVILIAALFVLGEGLVRTGITARMGDWMTRRAGASETRLIFFLMVSAAALSSIMSSTGVVAIFIPIVLRMARRMGVPAGRLMMPLAMAAMIAGMTTLVATAPNLVVHGELVRRGLDGFGFFAFAPFGVPILALAILYMFVARRYLGQSAQEEPAPRASIREWIDDFALEGREMRLRIEPGSVLAGRRLDQLDLRSSAGVNIVAIERPGPRRTELRLPRAGTELAAGDVLLLDVLGDHADIDRFAAANRLRALPLGQGYFTDRRQDLGMAQVMVPPTSTLVGRSVVQTAFRTKRDLAVIGIRHGATPVTGAIVDEPLRAGDTLLVMGTWKAIRRLASERRDLILLDLPEEADEIAPEADRALAALAILGLVVVLMVTGIVPNVQAALLGCLLMGLFRCIDIAGAYRAINWQTLVLIVGMLPFSLALTRTGGVDLAATALTDALGNGNPRLVMAAIFVLTTMLSLFISNTATAVLMAPVALAIADTLGASPYPFAMTVALAASAAYMTPVSSPINTLVVGPGNYRFMDFVRIGTPFWLITLAVVLVMVPMVLPF
ncbi:SLC13 family permease [Rhodobacteraceae bacterium 2376]|uniref:SLC13 family permease n=1 Tax=Rhabdonatronobacter sediminivivens TaxID=2743469 RepID=A0A7Z0KXW0_9RHOB|nr:SLC13 family permease [Rhabdonatronobacter sediminivivens]NYS25177.1 SLC13 family permease [Rhabdonatronobacter sediminivivens]